MTYDKAKEIWQAKEGSKYDDIQIRALISSGTRMSGGDVANEGYAQSCAQLAQAMIAYNEMIDSQIEHAKQTWLPVR